VKGSRDVRRGRRRRGGLDGERRRERGAEGSGNANFSFDVQIAKGTYLALMAEQYLTQQA
jgi:hypothetical protein